MPHSVGLLLTLIASGSFPAIRFVFLTLRFIAVYWACLPQSLVTGSCNIEN